MEFFRFPRTPHLVWFGEGPPRQDKLLSPHQAREFLSHEIVVEEKIDGANVGFSINNGTLRAQNRGSYLLPEHSHRQFKPLFGWLQRHRSSLTQALGADLILFGEWCYAIHTIHYTKLPDWFLGFDIYERSARRFWSTARRDRFLRGLGLAVVPRLGAGNFDVARLGELLDKSQLRDGPPEGAYLRRDEGKYLVSRAKLVRSEFTQAIGEHWSHRPLQANTLEKPRARFPT
jgi:ATP-dependent RNA circularization protein (DNA/RNA ligase family)